MGDSREDFNDYCDMWDKACSDGIFDDAPSAPPTPTTFLGLGGGFESDGFEDQEPDFVDEELIHERAGDPYFDYVQSMINENKKAPTKKSVKKVTENKKSPNPIYPDSIGKDQSSPKAAWLNNKVLEEVVKLKQQLYNLECKINTTEGGGKKWSEKAKSQPEGTKLWTQIESLRKKIDILSDSLGLKDESEQSTWNVKG